MIEAEIEVIKTLRYHPDMNGVLRRKSGAAHGLRPIPTPKMKVRPAQLKNKQTKKHQQKNQQKNQKNSKNQPAANSYSQNESEACTAMNNPRTPIRFMMRYYDCGCRHPSQETTLRQETEREQRKHN